VASEVSNLKKLLTNVVGRFKEAVTAPAQLDNQFRFFDKDFSGTLSFDEFMKAL